MTRQLKIGIAILLIGLLTIIVWSISQFVQPTLPPDINSKLILFFVALVAVVSFLASFKDTIELINILVGRSRRAHRQTQPISQTHFHGAVDAQVVVTGGQNVNVYPPPPQSANESLVYSETLRQQVELFRQILGEINIQQSPLQSLRVEAYSGAWRVLQAVKLAGDALWEEASEINILRFAQALKMATVQVDEDAPFFNKDDLRNLRSVLKAFGNFRAGKQRLYEIRFSEDISDNYALREIRHQIDENRRYKGVYKNLLERILESFRNRLSYD